jgi:hypothetical protein
MNSLAKVITKTVHAHLWHDQMLILANTLLDGSDGHISLRGNMLTIITEPHFPFLYTSGNRNIDIQSIGAEETFFWPADHRAPGPQACISMHH